MQLVHAYKAEEFQKSVQTTFFSGRDLFYVQDKNDHVCKAEIEKEEKVQ